MPKQPDQENRGPERDPAEYACWTQFRAHAKKDTLGEFLFRVFYAVIFLGMIGLVFYNAMLRYLFVKLSAKRGMGQVSVHLHHIFGSIGSFLPQKHIAVDMFVDMLHGTSHADN